MRNQQNELDEVLEKEIGYVQQRGGYWGLTEFDQGINDIQREKIKAFKNVNNQCYLGKINFYNVDRENIDSIDILIPYEDQTVYNFEYDFYVNCYDEELVTMIKAYNKETKASEIKIRIEDIIKKIEANGSCLTWV